MKTLARSALVVLTVLTASCASPTPDDGETGGSALTQTYAGDFAEGTPEAKAIVAVANDRALDVATYTKSTSDGGLGLDPVFAQALVDRRGATDMYESLAELNALPNASRDAFLKLFDWAKKKSPAYGSVGVSVLRQRLMAGETFTVACSYTWYVSRASPSPYGGGGYEQRSGFASYFARLDGDTLTLSDKKIIGDIQGSAWWAPSELAFRFVGDVASQQIYGMMTYSLRLGDDQGTFEYTYSGATTSNPDSGDDSHCTGTF